MKVPASLDYADVGALWRSNYDMPPDHFSAGCDRLWTQLRPFYLSLHAYVRGQLAKNMAKLSSRRTARSPLIFWATSGHRNGITFIRLMESPKPAQSYDLTKILVDRKTDSQGMVRYGERFLQIPRIRSAPGNFLGALSFHEARGS